MKEDILADLQRQIADLQAVNEEFRLLSELLQVVNQGVGLVNQMGVILYANPCWSQMHGFPSPEEMLGQDFFDLFVEPDLIREAVEEIAFGSPWLGQVACRRFDGSTFPADLSIFALGGANNGGQVLGCLLQDITERKRAEEALRNAYEEQGRLREEVIAAQRRIIGELSTPVIPLMEGVLVMPIVGSVDSERAKRITEVVLEAVPRYRARVVMMDITGVPVVDTAVADALLRTAVATRLLGAEAVLVGISPAVAQTIVQLGVDLGELTTRADLQSGVEYALRIMRKRLSRPRVTRADTT